MRFTSLISRAIETRRKIDDCWMAQMRPRVSSASQLASDRVTPW